MTQLRVVAGESSKEPQGKEGKGGRPSGDFDPWDTEKGHEYDPDHFYTRSTNKHDHSIDVRFRFPPQLGAMVSEIVDGKKFPQLRSIADFYRDAAVHRLHHLNEMIQDGKYERVLSHEMRLARVLQNKEEMEAMQAVVAAHRDTLQAARQIGDVSVMIECVKFLEDDITVAREPYRNELREMARDYRGWLKGRENGEGEGDE